MLNWFSLLLEVTCVIFAHATNTDVWEAIVVHATKSKYHSPSKTSVRHETNKSHKIKIPIRAANVMNRRSRTAGEIITTEFGVHCMTLIKGY